MIQTESEKSEIGVEMALPLLRVNTTRHQIAASIPRRAFAHVPITLSVAKETFDDVTSHQMLKPSRRH